MPAVVRASVNSEEKDKSILEIPPGIYNLAIVFQEPAKVMLRPGENQDAVRWRLSAEANRPRAARAAAGLLGPTVAKSVGEVLDQPARFLKHRTRLATKMMNARGVRPTKTRDLLHRSPRFLTQGRCRVVIEINPRRHRFAASRRLGCELREFDLAVALAKRSLSA